MKEEPRSHKQAAVASFLVVLILAYGGSYLWKRKHPDMKMGKMYFLSMPFHPKSRGAVKFWNEFYGPLVELDLRFTGKTVVFVTRGPRKDEEP